MENYPKYYVNCSLEFEELMGFLLSLMSGERQRRVIYLEDCSLSVIQNKDHDTQKVSKDITDFVYYPYYLELEAESEIEFDAFFKIAEKLFNGLKDAGIGVTVASDFEEMLPGNGSYVV